MLDSPEDLCAGQARFEYPATSVPFGSLWAAQQVRQLAKHPAVTFSDRLARFNRWLPNRIVRALGGRRC
jgi:hypothetical protein